MVTFDCHYFTLAGFPNRPLETARTNGSFWRENTCQATIPSSVHLSTPKTLGCSIPPVQILTQNLHSFRLSVSLSLYQMNPSEASLIPFKSKKPHLHLKPPNTNQLSSKTPEKPTQLPRRSSRNRGVALSINEVRRVAESLQDPDRPDSLSPRPKSAKGQIESWPAESPTRKPKKPAGGPFKLPGK